LRLNKSPSSVRGRDESRPYFVTFVPFVVNLLLPSGYRFAAVFAAG
jgi:hypothetical protein